MDINQDDILGMTFTASSKTNSSGTGWQNAKGEAIKLEELTPYHAVLTEIVPIEDQWGKQLRWMYELQGEQFTCKNKEGKHFQFKVSGKTSYMTGPKSALRKVYSKLINREVLDDEKFTLKPLIGLHVDIFVKISKGKPDAEGRVKDWYNMENLKLRVPQPNAVSAPVAPVVTQVQKPEVQQQVVPPAVVAPVTPVAPVVTPPQAAVVTNVQQTVKTDKAIKDIFNEID